MNQNINTTVSAITQIVTGVNAVDLTTESQNLMESATTIVPPGTTILDCFTV